MSQSSKYTFLFVPGNKSDEFLNKLIEQQLPHSFPANLIFDLEDSIPDELKNQTRSNLTSVLNHALSRTWPLNIYVRINAKSSSFFTADSSWFEPFWGTPIGLFLSKCESENDIKTLIEQRQSNRNPIIPIVETLNGYMNRMAISQYVAEQELTYISFGAGDMSMELDIQRNYSISLLQHALLETVLAAKMHGLSIIDSPSRILPKADSLWAKPLEEECRWSVENGFNAKFAIHPEQVEFIERIFAEKYNLDSAQQKRDAFKSNRTSNALRASENGNYIGLPVLKHAQRIIDNLNQNE
jgi:citrate lyase beta subunit